MFEICRAQTEFNLAFVTTDPGHALYISSYRLSKNDMFDSPHYPPDQWTQEHCGLQDPANFALCFQINSDSAGQEKPKC